MKHVIGKCDSIAKDDSIINTLDFNKYDYITSLERKVADIEYDSEYVRMHDHCDYIPDLKPLKVIYSEEKYKNKLFIYQIFEKNKYRHLCP